MAPASQGKIVLIVLRIVAAAPQAGSTAVTAVAITGRPAVLAPVIVVLVLLLLTALAAAPMAGLLVPLPLPTCAAPARPAQLPSKHLG
jgi:hypothetical protein